MTTTGAAALGKGVHPRLRALDQHPRRRRGYSLSLRQGPSAQLHQRSHRQTLATSPAALPPKMADKARPSYSKR